MKKIYFAGSIRGGRADADIYQRIIELMQHNNTVLTEHVGNLELSVLEQENDREEQIYNRDISWLRQADMVIAECTCPSHGVGYELAFAEKLGIPCHVFYNQTKCQLSAMIRGDRYFNVYPYKTEEQLFRQLDTILEEQ